MTSLFLLFNSPLLRMKMQKYRVCPRDQGFRLRLSRVFVKAKLKNQRSFLVRYQRNRSDIDLKKYIDILDNCVLNTQDKGLSEFTSLNQVKKA